MCWQTRVERLPESTKRTVILASGGAGGVVGEKRHATFKQLTKSQSRHYVGSAHAAGERRWSCPKAQPCRSPMLHRFQNFQHPQPQLQSATWTDARRSRRRKCGFRDDGIPGATLSKNTRPLRVPARDAHEPGRFRQGEKAIGSGPCVDAVPEDRGHPCARHRATIT